MASELITAPVEQPALTAHDRCDRCGAQAYVRVLLATGELLFCGHDYYENESKVAPMAQQIDDQRWRLTIRPKPEDSPGLV